MVWKIKQKHIPKEGESEYFILLFANSWLLLLPNLYLLKNFECFTHFLSLANFG